MAVKIRYDSTPFKERQGRKDAGKNDLPDNCLAVVNPELASEWHPTKNGDLTPKMVTKGSDRKVWWIGRCGHEWQAVAHSRIQGSNCPYCSGQKVLRGFNDLTTLNPDLAAEWHPTKNGNLTPDSITVGSGKKVWWIDKYRHEWQAPVAKRNNGLGCPYCSGNKVLKGFNDLATINPELAVEWHPMKNGELTPDKVTVCSGKKVWWVDKYGHEWQAPVAGRNNGLGCPYCASKKVLKGFNDLATVLPELAKEWHPTKNGDLRPTMVTKGTQRKVWWLGKCGHEWQTAIANRSKGCGCPICRDELKTSFAEQAVYYYIHKYYDEVINRDVSMGKEFDIFIPSINTAIEYDGSYFHTDTRRDIQKNIWCQKHDIRLIRIREKECPELNCDNIVVREGKDDDCLNKAITDTLFLLNIEDCSVDVNRDRASIYDQYVASKKQHSLAVQNPETSAEWHPTKNKAITPDMVSLNSSKKVWWLGKCGHEWQAVISNRSKGIGCPYCSGQRTLKGYNDLATTNPELVKEWHPTKNKNLTPDVVAKHSNKKVWWLGKCGHEWTETINNRSQNRGCPYCAGKKVLTGFNDLETCRPDLATEWHPTRNGVLRPTMVTKGTQKKVWWLGKCGHEWQATIASRNSGNGCPYCSGRFAIKGVSDLASTNPVLAAEWDLDKNGNLKPDMFSSGSHQKVWWKCAKGHEWQATIKDRSGGRKCPYCSGRRVLKGFNDLETSNPVLASEWHPVKNGSLTPNDVSKGSGKEVWWKGKCGHEWRTSVYSRSSGNGCPICRKSKNKQ